jgi:glutamate dehydrogenase
MPEDLAKRIALIPLLTSACDIIRISLEENTNLRNTARVYFELGERFHLSWLRQQTKLLPQDDAWQIEAVNGIIESLYGCQAAMTVKILKDLNGKVSKTPETGSILDKWLEKQPQLVQQLDPFFSELRNAATIDITMIAVADQRLRLLCA